MLPSNIIEVITNKCDIYFGKELISKENVIKTYMSFLADSLSTREHSVHFSLHTGSLCFDIVSVIYLLLDCLSYNIVTNDDIVSSLREGDIIIFKGKRYRWQGVETRDDKLYMIIEQDGRGKNGGTVSRLLLENNKHHIKPYYGNSKTTDGRGIRKQQNNREDFLSYVFGVNKEEIPTQFFMSAIIVAERKKFEELFKQIRIKYNNDKEIRLFELVPAAYYTDFEEEYQLCSNPTKAEPVLKVANNISTARDLILNKSGNKAVGLLVTECVSPKENISELDELIRRKSLKTIYITSPLKEAIVKLLLNNYTDASIFACTKAFLKKLNISIQSSNYLTRELQRQILNITNNQVNEIILDNGLSWEKYRNLKNAILSIKQSGFREPLKTEFIIHAYSLLNLLNTMVFPVEAMEVAIDEGKINRLISSPKTHIAKLYDILKYFGSMEDKCGYIVNELKNLYETYLINSPKSEYLKNYLFLYRHSNILIVVPKAYYIDILRIIYSKYFQNGNLTCITPNHFDLKNQYDIVLCVGDIANKKFEPLLCYGSKVVDVLLYPFEKISLGYRKRKLVKYENQLNKKLGIYNEYNPTEENENKADISSDIERFSKFDEDIKFLNIQSYVQRYNNSVGRSPEAEVKYIGSCITGEIILFSKYYSAVVIDKLTGKVYEKTPEQLQSGDTLLFVTRNNYTKNIVDYIYETLLKGGYLSKEAIEAYEKSLYWKNVLREYKKKHNFTYKEVAQYLRNAGSNIQEMAVRGWLIDDSHIVGPRDIKTLEYIAVVTMNNELMENSQSYFTACKMVRSDRRQILNFISKAVTEKISGNVFTHDPILKIVYDNMERLSKTIELENISEMEESRFISINLVNFPINETEA